MAEENIIVTILIAIVIALIIILLLKKPKTSVPKSEAVKDPCAGTLQPPISCKLTKPAFPSHTWFITWEPSPNATEYDIIVDFYDFINDDDNTIKATTSLPNYTLMIDSNDFSEDIEITVTIVALERLCNKRSKEVTFKVNV